MTGNEGNKLRWARHLFIPSLLVLFAWVPAWNFVPHVLGVALLVTGTALMLLYTASDRSTSAADEELYREAVKRGDAPGYWH